MAYRLAPAIHLALIGDRVIVLDLAADRYRALGAQAAAALRALERGEYVEHEATLQALDRMKILERGAGAFRFPSIEPPLHSAQEWARVMAAPVAAHKVAASLFRAMASLRFRGLQATLTHAPRPDSVQLSDPEPIIGFARGYARARARVPVARICLRDSLALHAALASVGFATSLVIGVRVDPFAAHSWVQAGTVVLNDHSDAVSGYTPILVQ